MVTAWAWHSVTLKQRRKMSGADFYLGLGPASKPKELLQPSISYLQAWMAWEE